MGTLKYDATDDAFDVADGSPGSLNRFIDKLVAIRNEIPGDWCEDATCTIETVEGWYGDCSYLKTEICYTRPETDEEVVARRRDEDLQTQARAVKQAQYDYAQFLTLKRRFES